MICLSEWMKDITVSFGSAESGHFCNASSI